MQWDLNKINSLISNKIEENLNLDYKASASLGKQDKKVNEISKDVSAFANSDGGTIIYGVSEDPEKRHLPQGIDPIDRNLVSKEWLEQIIQGNIRPRIDGIKIHPVTVNEQKGHVIYVVDIPKSNTAHQAKDKKYYKRYNFNSEAMLDYEIRDVLNRTKDPIIDLEFEILSKTVEVKASPSYLENPILSLGSLGGTEPEKKVKTYLTLRVWAVNTGRVLAQYLNADIGIPYEYLAKNEENKEGMATFFMDNTVREVVDVQFFPSMTGSDAVEKLGPSRYDPILPKRFLLLKKIGLNPSVLTSEEVLQWIVYCDNAEPREGEIKWKEIKVFEND